MIMLHDNVECMDEYVMMMLIGWRQTPCEDLKWRYKLNWSSRLRAMTVSHVPLTLCIHGESRALMNNCNFVSRRPVMLIGIGHGKLVTYDPLQFFSTNNNPRSNYVRDSNQYCHADEEVIVQRRLNVVYVGRFVTVTWLRGGWGGLCWVARFTFVI